MSDRVFKEVDGKLEFVGDFDGLYREEADPWGQSGQVGDTADYYALSRSRVAEAMARHLPNEGRRLEIGCGHGWTLPQFEAAAGGRWEGMDISKAAIERAKQVHPRFAFCVGDITDRFCIMPSYFGRYHAVILSHLLWYVLPKLEDAISNAARFLEVGGLLIISQAFLRDQRYGREIVDGFRGTLAFILAHHPALELVEARYDDSGALAFNDGLLIFRKTRHAE